MKENMYEKQILDAIQTLVDNAIDNAKFDKTIKGIISKCVDEKNGKYVVIYQDSSFYAYSNDTTQIYNAGTQVYVLIPGNDMTQTKTILGSVNKLGSDYINSIEENNRYDIIGNNVINFGDDEIGICSYKEGGDACILYDKMNTSSDNLIDIDITAANTYIKQAHYLSLGGIFKTNLNREQKYKGNYGLGFDLNFTDNMTGETVKRTYLIDVNSMTGNPYEYTKATEQKKIFSIDGENFVDIDKIYLFGYDFPNSSSEEKPKDIYILNASIEAAELLSNDELNGNKLTLITPQGIYFDAQDSSESIRTINTEIKIDNKIVNTDSSLLKYYWFKENYSINQSSLLYNRYGGNAWECLNEKNIVERDENNNPILVDWITNQSNYIVKKENLLARTTDYKCVVVYNNEIVLTKKLTIYNYSSNYIVTIDSDSGVYFSYDNGSPTLTCNVNVNGNYTYKWGMFDNSNTFSKIEETTQRNTNYHTTLNNYNNLQTGLANGTILLTAERQQELAQLKYELEQLNSMMRAEGNTIYNLQLNMITNFANFICTVYDSNNKYIGKGQIKIENDLNRSENKYTLVINHGDQVFKYNNEGISPASKSLEKPQEIYPLSFTLFDEKGIEIDNSLINAKNVFWTVPTNNTMIKVSAVHGNPISKDEFNETETYTEYKEFFFNIPTLYSGNKNRNTIQLKVKYKDKIVITETELLFLKEGESGSNGTDFVCRIVPNTIDGEIAPLYPIVTYDNNAIEGTVNPTINFIPRNENVWFKAQLYHNGSEIFNGTSSEDKNITIKWEIMKNRYVTINNVVYEDVSNFNVNENTGVFSYNNLDSVTDETLKSNPANIVKCTLTYDGIDYIATIPIILVKVNNGNGKQYKVSLNDNTGFRYAMYTTDGRKPIYDNSNPFALKVIQTVEGVDQDISINTMPEYSIEYDWSENAKGIIYADEWKEQSNLIIDTLRDRNLQKNEKYYKPVDEFNGLCLSNALYCEIKRDNNTLASIHIPIHLYLNRYGNAAMNSWDGNSISIDENGGVILAPQIGAGQKENDNSFTGVFMGTVAEAGSGETETGLFGYNSGARTLELNAKDGSVKFGKKGQGQIIIDPGADESRLYSDGYQIIYLKPSDAGQTKYLGGYTYFAKDSEKNKYYWLKPNVDYTIGDNIPSSNWTWNEKTVTTWLWDTSANTEGRGLEIDLNDPHIRFGNGKFHIEKDGSVYATGFATVAELEAGDINIPGVENFKAEYATDRVEFTTDSTLTPVDTSLTKTITGKCLYKDNYISGYTVELINSNGVKIIDQNSNSTIIDGIEISIEINGQTFNINFNAAAARQWSNVVNNYTFRFSYTPIGGTLQTLTKIFSANAVMIGADGRSITSAVVEYKASTSATTPPTGTWSGNPVDPASGEYLWTRTTINYNSGNPTITYSISYKAQNGINGVNGLSSYTHIKYSINSTGNPMVNTPTSETKYIGICVNNSSTAPSTYTSYTWSKYIGENGSDGNGIKNTNISYKQGDNGVDIPSDTPEWSSTPIQVDPGKYLWTRTIITYDDDTTSTSYSVARMGVNGQPGAQGPKGDPGKDGTSVTVKGSYDTLSELTTAHPSGNVLGDGYVIGLNLYIYTNEAGGSGSLSGDWKDVGQFKGEDAYTVVLSNESHTFPATNSAATISSTTIQVSAYKGGSTIVPSIGTITGQVTGLTTSISGTTITVSADTTLTTPNGELTIPITVDGKQFTKIFSWSLAKAGSNGTSPTAYSLIVSHAAIVKNANGTYTPNAIKLIAKSQTGSTAIKNFTTGRYAIFLNGSSTATTTPASAANYSYTIPTGTDSIRIALYNSSTGTTILDEQTVSIVTDGNGIIATDIKYLNDSQGTTPPGDSASWSSSIPAEDINKRYLWTRTRMTYSDGSVESSYSISYKGLNGTNGTSVTISSQEIKYGYNNSGTNYSNIPATRTTQNPGGWDASIPAAPDGSYLWTRTKVNYSDGNSTTSYSVSYQSQDGTNGIGISSITNYYLAINQSSGVTRSTSGWTTDVQAITEAKPYLWNYEDILYSNNTHAYTTPAVIGRYGKDGTNGANGRGIASITEYYAINNSTTAPADSAFSTTVKAPTSANKYLWNYEKITYENPSSTVNTAKHIIGTYGRDGVDGNSIVWKGDLSSAPSNPQNLWAYYNTTDKKSYIYNGTEWETMAIDGTPGAKGQDATQYYYHVVYCNNTSTGAGYSVTPNNQFYTGTYVDTLSADATTWSAVSEKNVKWNYTKGVDSTNIVCGNEAETIVCSSDGKVKAKTTITIPFAGYIGSDRAACTVAYSTLPSGISLVSNTAATAGSSGNDGSLVLEVAAAATLGNTDTGIITLTFTCNSKTFVKKFTWAKAIAGTNGINGTSPYNAILTNESQTIAGDISKAIPTTITTHIMGYLGTTQQNTTIGTISGLPTGMTAVINNNNSKNASVTFTVTSSMTTKSGQVTIPITMGSTTINKIFSYSLSLTGATGATGTGTKYYGTRSWTNTQINNTYVIGFSSTGWDNNLKINVQIGDLLLLDVTNSTNNSKLVYILEATSATTSGGSVSGKIVSITKDGATGATGTGVSSIVEEYYLSNSKTTQSGGQWVTSPPQWEYGKYIWTRSKITYSNPESIEYTTPICSSEWEAVNDLSINTGNLWFNGQEQAANSSQWDRGLVEISYNDLPNSPKSFFKFRGNSISKYYVPYDINKLYKIEVWIKAIDSYKTSTGLVYPSIIPYDMDKNQISQYNVITNPNTRTALAQDLNPGDTVIYAENLKSWITTANDYSVYVGIYGYKSSTGYEYEDYTRNVINFANYGEDKTLYINKEANTITLKQPYEGPIVKAGTQMSQHKAGATYAYPFGAITYNTVAEWTKKETVFSYNFDPKMKAASYIRFLTFSDYLWYFYLCLTEVTDEEKIKTTVKTVDVEYYLSTSSTEATGGSWSTVAPAWQDNKYMWSRQKVTYVNGTTATRNETCIAGASAKLVDITASSQTFKSTDGGSTFSPDTIILTPRFQVVKYSKWQYSTNNGSSWTDVTSGQHGLTISNGVLTISKSSDLYSTTVTAVCFKCLSDTSTVFDTMTVIKIQDGTNGRGISSITNYYLATSASSGVTRSTSGWKTAVQTMTATNQYLWNYEDILYTNNTHTYTDPVIIGRYGQNGAAGKGIASIVEYYAINNSTTAPADSAFGTNVVSPTATNKYLWNYELITYSNPTSTSTTDKRIIGTYGRDGIDGTSPYFSYLTNETQSFVYGIATTVTTLLYGYQGTTEKTVQIKTVNGVAAATSDTATGKTGMNFKVSSTSAVNHPTITFTTTTALPQSATERLAIVYRITGESADRTIYFSYSTTTRGAQGPQGNPGTSAKLLTINPSSQMFKSTTGANGTFTPQYIYLYPQFQNCSYSKWQYSTNGTTWTNVTSGSNSLTIGTYNSIANSLRIERTCNLFTSDITVVSFKCISNDATIYDTVTIIKLYDVTDIEIGGRNYILNSKNLYLDNLDAAEGSRREYGYINVGQSYMNIENGTKVVLSFDLEMKVGTANPTMQIYNTNQKGPKQFVSKSLSFTAAAGSTIKGRYSIISSIVDRVESVTNTFNAIEFYTVYGTNNFFKISNLKLEIGNKATDWTAAPEDLASNQILQYTTTITATPPTSSAVWGASVPISTEYYVWQRLQTIYDNDIIENSTPVCIYTPPIQISSIEEQYFIHTSSTTPPSQSSTSWLNEKPAWKDEYYQPATRRYLWVRTKYVYTGNTSKTEYSIPYYDPTWETISALNQSIIDNAQIVENAINNGYVTIKDGYIEIRDNADSSKGILLSKEGISFKINGTTYTSVWSLDGTFNAQSILVKNLNASNILSGTLTLQEDKDNQENNGVFLLKNQSGAEVAKIDVNGLKITAVDGSYIYLRTGEDNSNYKGIYLVDAGGNTFVSTNTTNGIFTVRKEVIEDYQEFNGNIRIISIDSRGIGFIGI